jgi:glycosyltransferase involved in cell wall biosynthesis
MKSTEVPAVSLVMGVFNGERFLADAVQSILDQDFSDFEFIIIDDGSTDDSATMLDNYQHLDARVKVWHEKHAGLVSSLNKGCELARGKYIARMDADDVAHRDRLSQQVAFMEAHPEVAVLGAAVEWISASGRSLYISKNPAKDEEIKADLIDRRRCAFWHPTIVMRREVFALTGGYRSHLLGAEDYDLWLRAADRFQLANLETVVLNYRIHSSQVSIQQRMQQTRSTLGAQFAARKRKEGLADPLSGVKEITPEVLIAWGISASEQRSEIFSDYRKWIRMMSNAGEYSSALKAAREVANTGIKDVERWQVADVYLMIANLLWRQREFFSSFLSAAHAVILRPMVIGRPLKRLLHSDAR